MYLAECSDQASQRSGDATTGGFEHPVGCQIRDLRQGIRSCDHFVRVDQKTEQLLIVGFIKRSQSLVLRDQSLFGSADSEQQCHIAVECQPVGHYAAARSRSFIETGLPNMLSTRTTLYE